MEKEYTLSIFTENKIGILHRITTIFTRRKINIDSLNTSESEVRGVYRYTLVIRVTPEMVEKVVKQIEKQIGVLKAFSHEEHEIVHQELALYKVPTQAFANGTNVEMIIRNHSAHILTVEPQYIVIEKTGHKEETQELFRLLEPFGVLQFVRSGRVAMTKPMKKLTSYLQELEEASSPSEQTIQ